MTREQAKSLFIDDKDAYGKPKGVMGKIDKIFDEFEKDKSNTLNRLDNGRDYLMGVNPKDLNAEDCLEAFGFKRNGLGDAE